MLAPRERSKSLKRLRNLASLKILLEPSPKVSSTELETRGKVLTQKASRVGRPKSFLALTLICMGIFLSISSWSQTQQTDQAENQEVSQPENESRSPDAAGTKKKSAKTTNLAKVVEAAGETVKAIQIEGNRKIEKDAILARLKSKEGQPFSTENVHEDLSSIFKMGYFYDAEVYRENQGGGLTLIYKVLEKPSIAEIKFEGQSELKEEEISEASGLKAYEILNMTKIRDATEKILKLYEDKGFFLAKVDYKLEDLAPGQTVKLTFKIEENEKVRVKKITFLGNKNLKDGKLKERMQTQEGGFFSFLSGSGSYKQDAFDRDMVGLKFLYFNDGYVQVKIDRPQVYVTPDKKSIYITIRIEEGEQFYVGDIDFSGDLLFERQELFDTIGIDDSHVFAYETLQRDLSNLQAKYGDLGYAFANVIPRTRVNEKERKVDITFEFDKGHKVYFGQINMVGNSKTRDKVIRRELKIREGELYHETRKRQSLENVQRLGYFEEVNFKTSTPADKQDQLNIDIVVKERNTGSIQIGAGYGSSQGFTLQGSVRQDNFLGKGQKLSASLQHSGLGSFYNFNFTEPYLYDTRWSVGFDLYKQDTGRQDYDETRLGAAFRFGHPLGENIFGYLKYKAEQIDLRKRYDGDTLITDPDLFPIDGNETSSPAKGLLSSVTASLEYDTRNDRFSPSKGILTSLALEYAGVGGDLKYTKGTSTFRYYKKVFWDVVLRNNLTYGFIASHDGKTPPFNELFLLGGPYSLRGFQLYTVGKRKLSKQLKTYFQTPPKTYSDHDAEIQANRPYGGTQELFYTAELEFPLINEAGIKGVVFYDIGQAEDNIVANGYNSDVGFGFRWFSPIGPLRFEWGFPLDGNPDYHQPVNFEFSIGTPF